MELRSDKTLNANVGSLRDIARRWAAETKRSWDDCSDQYGPARRLGEVQGKKGPYFS